MASKPRLSKETTTTLRAARKFIRMYITARKGLKRLGILRSERNLQGDFAEWYVSKLLDLQLSESSVEAGFDATDRQGRRYQVKSRVVGSLWQTTSFDFSDISKPFEFLVAVFLSTDLEPWVVIRVPYGVVKELGYQTQSTFRFRWNSRVAADGRIERLIWPSEDAA
jgi:hypothetical protein